MCRAGGKDDCIVACAAETICPRFQPEQSREYEPVLLEIIDQFGFPFLERLHVSGVGRLSCERMNDERRCYQDERRKLRRSLTGQGGRPRANHWHTPSGLEAAAVR